MKVRVEEDLCIGCGICEDAAPEVFTLQNGPVAQVIMDPVSAECEEAARQAVEDCPEGAIEMEDEEMAPPDKEITTEVFEETEVEVSSPIYVSERERRNESYC